MLVGEGLDWGKGVPQPRLLSTTSGLELSILCPTLWAIPVANRVVAKLTELRGSLLCSACVVLCNGIFSEAFNKVVAYAIEDSAEL